MSRDSAWRTSLKKLANTPAGLFEALYIPGYLQRTEDRIAGLLAATDVEDALEGVIRAKTVRLTKTEENELFGLSGPLGTHGIRIKYGYAFGFFGKKTRADLETIRLIRNAFAHSRQAIWFSTPEIKYGCKMLTAIDRAPSSTRELYRDRSMDDPKPRFLTATDLLRRALVYLSDPELFADSDPTVPLD